ncbi:MAG: site-specific DNA-methyltransferase [Helicobacter sp.]|nr:site-specific DNA-methyltransferase [Helicobacteraceae bacterium]MDY3113252.1 site-specific DNA-methyltransferase [Helicobacter sp.]
MKLFNADSYEIISEFQNLKVNHIITDPPYNISQKNGFSKMKQKRSGLDFGLWDYNFDLFAWIPLYAEVLDKNGSMIIFCSYRYLSFIINALEDSSLSVKDILVWQKSNPMPRNVKRRYVQDMEFAIWAVKKGAKWIFNKPESKAYLRAFFTSSVVNGREKLGHPTQKSLKVMKNIIEIHTNKGELILDPFMGSGSTGEAALALGRDFIGVERDFKYFKMAQKRLLGFKESK